MEPISVLNIMAVLTFERKINNINQLNKLLGRVIKHFHRELKFESSLFLYYTIGDKLSISKCFGDKEIIKDYPDYISGKKNTNNVLILPFKLKGPKKYNGEVTYGYFLFRDSKWISRDVIYKQLTIIISRLIKDSLDSIIERSVSRFDLNHNILFKKHRKPGTIVARTLEALKITFRPTEIYFGIICKAEYRNSYKLGKHKRHPLIVQGQKFRKIPAEILKFISIKKPFIWSFTEEPEEIEKLLMVESREGKYNYFVYPIINDLKVIALVTLAYHENQYWNDNQLRGFHWLNNEYFNTASCYLFQRETRNMIVSPIFKSRETRTTPKSIFVIMPFALEWSDRIWNKILKPIIVKQGYSAKRADDMYGADIMEDVWKGILSAEIVIADITERNANVFYELGIAHTLGKEVILITQEKKDIPFDLNRYRHIVYKDNVDGYELLEKNLINTINEIRNHS